jgi:hypothetical protein
MTISHRTQTLIDLVPPGHRWTQPMIAVITDVSAAYEGFSGHRIALQSKLKPQALGEELNKSFKENYGKQWTRANSSVAKLRQEIEAKRGSLVLKPGPTTSAGAISHWENRTWFNAQDIGARQGIALSTEDPDLLHAILLKPQQSGLAGLSVPVIAQVTDRYLGITYPTERAAIAADDAVVVPPEQAIHMSRNEMRATLGLHQIEFDAMLKTIEIGRPWIVGDKGFEQVCEISSDGKASYHPASASEIENGIRGNYSEYQAALAA